MILALATLLLQLAVILVAARLCGLALERVGQPPVIGEMAAGVLLGPMVFGAALPQLQAALFPPASLRGLEWVSTLGLVLFVFLVGAEMRAPGGLRAQLTASGRVGALSLLIPMGLGLAIAPLLHPRYAPADARALPFALFIAVALSVTAFPVMARILKDRALAQTPVGRLCIGAAAIVDAGAWVGLALVAAVVPAEGSWRGFAMTLAGLAALSVALLFVVRPMTARLLARSAPGGRAHAVTCSALLAVLLACAGATHWLGLHPVFGAFLFGASLPRCDALLACLTGLLERVTMVVLLPVFFVLAGLGTSAGALAGTSLAAFALLLLAAVAGKVLGGTAGARCSGHGWRESFAVGVLMNTRGLMELVVIRIGLEAGLIGPELFTMLLLMTLITTLMTSPLLALLAPTSRAR